MKLKNLTTGVMLSTVFCLFSGVAQAQCDSCESGAIVGEEFVSGDYDTGEMITEEYAGGGCVGSGRLKSGIANTAGAVVSTAGSVAGTAIRTSLGLSNARNGAIYDADGRVQPQADCMRPKPALALAATDAFSPNPVYAYSSAGLRSGHMHSWNQQQASMNSWHGGYNSWRYGQPTALVVPPTASYQSTYSWGVGQTRSTPIHHQFGRGAGSYGGMSGGYQNRPYFPWSTDQFGIYPVRASW